MRLGADAVGYTLYVGSPSQEIDIAQCNEIRRDCDRYGMPLVVWAYPGGAAIKAKGGIDSLYAVDYASGTRHWPWRRAFTTCSKAMDWNNRRRDKHALGLHL